MFRKPSLKVRVVSYNVLSSHLASPSHFVTLNPAHLESIARLPVVLQKLDSELDAHSNVIVCLQEVSYDWLGKFHAYFANRGYHMVSANYGRKFNGYMGVVLAWPMKGSLQTVSVDVSRLSDTRPDGWPEEPQDESSKPGTIRKLVSSSLEILQAVVSMPLQKLGLLATSGGGSRDAEPWEYSESRMNAMLTAVLRDKESGIAFGIANYHMPCSHWDGRIMTLHADLCLAHVQRIAQGASSDGSDPVPYILAGDFNIKPTESVYRYLTTGTMNAEDPAHPGTKAGVSWKPSIREHVRSAYAVMQGKEPDFTNYALVQSKDKDPFIDTLDYIFLSPAWKVDMVRELPSLDESGGPFPNLDRGEPSDHLLIAASLSIPIK